MADNIREPKKNGVAVWMWASLIILSIIVIALCLSFCCRSSHHGTESDTVVVTNTVAREIAPDSLADVGDAAATLPAQLQTALANYQDRFDAVEFPVNEFRLNSEARIVLDSVADLMKDYPGLRITVNGYASPEGNRAANLALSEERAESVVRYLESRGIAYARLRAVGCGTSHPISRQLAPNRRIEFIAG